MNLIDTIRGVEFDFGIGDPTLVGWLTVVAYLAAAALAAINAWLARPGADRTVYRLWSSLTVLLVFLAVNKQLDLQSYVTAIGRAVAREQGWYEARGNVQLVFILAVAVATVILLALATWALRGVRRQQWLTLVGITMILGFVLVRASSFHYVDALIGLQFRGFRVNWIIELGAIGIFGIAAINQIRRSDLLVDAEDVAAPTCP